jgi:hypothetical protein
MLLAIVFLFSGITTIFAIVGLLIGGYSIYWFAVHAEYFNPALSSETAQPIQPAGDS